MQNELWLDCDGVLLDWVTPFLTYLHMRGIGLNINKDDIRHYDFREIFPDVAKLQKHIKEFNKSMAYWELPSMADAADLKRLTDAGWKLKVITQIVEHDVAVQEGRLRNLGHNFPGLFDSIEFTYPGQCKLDVIRAKRDGRIIIVEDAPKLLKKANDITCHDIEQDGTSSLLTFAVRHPYNTEETALKYVMPVDGMQQVTKMLLHLEGKPYV